MGSLYREREAKWLRCGLANIFTQVMYLNTFEILYSGISIFYNFALPLHYTTQILYFSSMIFSKTIRAKIVQSQLFRP